jgi:hypothetical protein
MLTIPQNSVNLLNTDQNFFSSSPIQVDSPLVSTDKIDEKEECFSKFGRIKIFFSSDTSQEIFAQKIFAPSKNLQEESAFFFEPIWKREGDPYKTATYSVTLTGWVLKKGQLSLSNDQKAIVFNALKFLEEKGVSIK